MRATLLIVGLAACECGKVAVTSANLAKGDSYSLNGVPDLLVGGIKASWDKKFQIGSEDITLSTQYEAKDFSSLRSPSNFKEVSVSGSYALDVAQPGWNTHKDGHPFKIGYSVAHKLSSGITGLKLTASTFGASLKAKADTSGAVSLDSVSYGYGVKAAGTTLTVDNEFEFHGPWGADSIYKFKFGGWGVTTSVSQPFSPVMPDLEVATSHEVAAGRSISSSVTVGPESSGGVYSTAKLTYSDKKLQKGATWEATASQPLTKLKGTKLLMKRSWSF